MAMSKKIVALTGGIGSGKSTVAGMFVERGVHLIDTDAIAHAISGVGGRAIDVICKTFGNEVLTLDGALDRVQMRARVFRDADARRRLEKIVHPMIRDEVAQALATTAAKNAPYVMLAVPLLFETMGYRGQIQLALVVDCPVRVQTERVMKRAGMPMAEVEGIITTQISRPLRLQLADDVVSNSGDMSSLLPQVLRLHEKYLSMSKTVQCV